MKHKICIVTSNRSDYSLLKPLILALKNQNTIDLKLIVTGSHLEKKFGYTIREIKRDKVKIDAQIHLQLNSDNELQFAKSMGKCLTKIAEYFLKVKPDLVVILGDRFEMLATASAAVIQKIPIGHIHGGEETIGSYDNSIRHAITKLSNVHFVSHKEYKKRVIQLGENPKNVHIVGALGVDSISQTKIIEGTELQEKFGINFLPKKLIVSIHPETHKAVDTNFQITTVLNALSTLKDTTIIFTTPSPEPGFEIILKNILKFVKRNPNSYFIKSLGQQNYYSMLSHVDGILGNSSSGILEAPYLKIGTINIGQRQLGRVQSVSILNCEFDERSILESISILYSKNFQKKLKRSKNVYGKTGASLKIVNILKRLNYDNLTGKMFYESKLDK